VTMWGLTIDCAHPTALAEFWALALGYDGPPPADEPDESNFLTDPAGVGPTLSFLLVPESKVVKNRVHIDVKAGGGRQTPWEQRWPRVLEAVQRLTTAGATVIREDAIDGKPDHMVMADPEGNEFCVV
jgi:Glyoxalase-like domain